ncbi:uncharacterized protein LOC122458298 [Dermochelys coriacea]|uniref:uncharacterized protein LOC122458298 n=1 Tax=Dermochelys coriacea TaxID=27794 RepID=UPI001CA9ED9B|nr:uncharacterized protein LOC122458298 [Dermochelys coriacea]
MPVESGLRQKEEILDKDVEGEGNPQADDDSEVRDAGSQELFSTPEEASQSQLSDLGEAQTGEEAPEMPLGTQPPSLLSLAERLCRITKRPRRTKEDFLREVLMHSTAEKQELKEWQDSKKRDRKENAARQNEAMEQLLNIIECQVDTLQVILALQTEQLCAHPPLQPLSQNSFPHAPPDTANTLLSTSCFQSVSTAFHSYPVTVQPYGLPVPTALNTRPSAV